jgi:hypothetical protein
MAETLTTTTPDTLHPQGQAPWPGSHEMPRWNLGPLVDAPYFTWRNWFAMLGPGLLMGGAAIGGGEWLMGPAVTARYGGALMWLATLSILGQVVYNLEISRYTLYSGEPIFTGKFRTLPGPRFWLTAYLVLDFGAVFPYLASNAAVPLSSVILGALPNAKPEETPWASFDLLGQHLDFSQAFLIQALAFSIFLASLLPLIFGGKIYSALKAVMTFKIVTVFSFLLFLAVCFSTFSTWREIGTGFVKFGTVPIQGANDAVDNVFLSLWRGDGLPHVDFSTIAMLAAFAAIAGQGGLSNAPLSNYTRDQGWGMGYHVGAIPSVIGGRNIALSHVGMVFDVTPESLPRWRRWYRHVMRDQLVVWMPACFIGLALPSMLSVQFVPRGKVADDWTVAGMTAGGVENHINTQWGPEVGHLFWYLTLLCGFLVLAPTMASTIDGFVRRWVDVFWTSSARLREWETKRIRNLYFYVLSGYSVFGLTMLYLGKPLMLLTIGTNIMNFALGFSCWHVLALNLILLPRELRPNWFMRTALFFAGLFFIVLSIIVAIHTASKFGLI